MENLMKKYESDFKNSETEKIGLLRDLKTSKLEIEKQNSIISALEGLKSQLLSDIKSLTKKVFDLFLIYAYAFNCFSYRFQHPI